MATLTLQLHLDAEHNPILPEGFGVVPVAVNGKRYRATVSRTLTDETGTKIHLWMEPDGVPGGPDGPVLLTLDELGHSVSAAEREAARAAR